MALRDGSKVTSITLGSQAVAGGWSPKGPYVFVSSGLPLIREYQTHDVSRRMAIAQLPAPSHVPPSL